MRISCRVAMVLAAVGGAALLPAQSTSNGSFDADVSGWTESLKSALAWDPLDAAGSATSGSARVTNQSDTAGDSTGANQCVEGLSGGATLRYSADLRIPGGQTETGRAHLLVQWYSDSCGGQQAGDAVVTQGIRTSSPDAWIRDRGTVVAPEGTRFARVRLSVWKDGSTGTLVALFDNVVFELAARHLVLIPAAGLASGAAGSFWVTDLEVNNPGAETMTYSLWWLPRDGDNFEPASSPPLVLGPGQSRRHEDVVGQVFGLDPDDSPFGAVAVASDEVGALAMGRVFNRPGAGGAGTFGQSMPGVAATELILQSQHRRILFLSEDPDLRANLGCQNGTGNDLRISLRLVAEAGTSLATRTLDLGPFSNHQLNRILQPWQPVRGYVDVWSDTPGAAFICYGSVLDNLSSDPTTVLPR